ncbi:MAG: hypothetical protein Q7T41_03490 [Candidatus Saccharibacteria bacterium]|nr:hypothetical protein [Candidatus Saccharibacteria bacterium]
MNEAQIAVESSNRSVALRMTAIIAAGATLAVACSDGGTETVLPTKESVATTTTVELSEAGEARAAELCPDGFENDMKIAKEFALSRVGNTDSLLPSFETVKNGEKTLATPYEVSGVVMDRACIEPTFLAVMDGIFLQTAGFNETGRYAKPDSTLISVIEERARLFRANEQAGLNSIENLASVIMPEGGVVYVDDFNSVSGQTTLITTERDENGNATQIISTKATVEGLLDGYQLRFNLDNTDLTPEQKATLKDISELVLIRPDGTILINDWLGENRTNFIFDEDSTDTTTVDTSIDESDTTIDENSGSGTTTATTPNGGTTGTTTGGGGTTPGTGTVPGTTTGGGNTTTTGGNNTTTTGGNTTTTGGNNTTTTQPERYDANYCDLNAPRPGGGYGIIKVVLGITAAELNALKADPYNDFTYTNIGSGNCKE